MIFNTVVCTEQEALSVAVQPVHASVGFMGGIVLIPVSVSSSSDGIGDDVGKIKEQPGGGLFTCSLLSAPQMCLHPHQVIRQVHPSVSTLHGVIEQYFITILPSCRLVVVTEKLFTVIC